MNPAGYPKPFDLEERTLKFAKEIRVFVKKLPRTLANFEDCKQLIRSSGSIGANYIEANEGLGKKDFVMRLRIARKEAKETRYWLRLVFVGENDALAQTMLDLEKEATELLLIFSAMIRKAE